MIDKTYEQMMSEAYAFTREMGLDTSDISYNFQEVDVQSICVDFTNYLIQVKKIEVYDLYFNCSPICIEIQSYLKTKSIDSIITSGNLYKDGISLFIKDKFSIQSQLGLKGLRCQFHTWLTINNYLIDPTLLFSLRYIDDSQNSYRFKKEKYRQSICQETVNNNRYELFYEPLFLGKDYFLKTDFQRIPYLIP